MRKPENKKRKGKASNPRPLAKREREMTNETKKNIDLTKEEMLIKYLGYEIELCNDIIAKFKVWFAQDELYAVQWADAMVKAVALKRYAQNICSQLQLDTKPATLETVMAFLKDTLTTKASCFSNSTSAMSNQVDIASLNAVSDIYKYCERLSK